MYSELHERLEYLVNYSSQLIFVSGDSIAQQQRTLEAFVFQQHDDTEIAFVTADPDLDISDYRRQLCRQLLGQVVGSYVRPLNELLASLNEHEGPILITITQAQHIPDRLLQELWDLVLQSRFAANKQHLNVLLFGESAWAENAKQWLPARNTDTPLLISSQSVPSQHESSELDRLISQRREAFHQHLAKRYGTGTEASANPLQSPWFWGAAGAVFICFFVALMVWQYGDQIDSLFTPINEQLQPASSETVEPGSAYEKVIAPNPNLDTDLPVSTPNETVSEEALVTGWNNAVEQLDRLQSAESEVASDLSVSSADEDAQSVTTDDSAVLTTSAKPENESFKEQEGDMAFLSQADAPVIPANTDNAVALTMAQPEAQPEALNEAQPSPDNIAVQPAAAHSTDNEELSTWVKANDYLIQLSGHKDTRLLNQFIRDNQLEAVTRNYKTFRYGGDWYVVIFHQAFPSLQEARAAIAGLPDYPGRSDAFVKRGDQVLNELQSAR